MGKSAELIGPLDYGEQNFVDRYHAKLAKLENKKLQLARDAAEVAVESIGAAYQNPHVRQAAMYAAELALGIREFPQSIEPTEPQQEGES